MADKPDGWRPFAPEHRESLSKLGFTDEQIDEQEAAHAYAPVANAVWSTEIAIAVMEAAARRFGSEFIADVRSILDDRQRSLAKSDDGEDRVDGQVLRELIDEVMDWKALTDRASGEEKAD